MVYLRKASFLTHCKTCSSTPRSLCFYNEVIQTNKFTCFIIKFRSFSGILACDILSEGSLFMYEFIKQYLCLSLSI